MLQDQGQPDLSPKKEDDKDLVQSYRRTYHSNAEILGKWSQGRSLGFTDQEPSELQVSKRLKKW